jgi:hypothetical protein
MLSKMMVKHLTLQCFQWFSLNDLMLIALQQLNEKPSLKNVNVVAKSVKALRKQSFSESEKWELKRETRSKLLPKRLKILSKKAVCLKNRLLKFDLKF